jgi:LysM repeat protein
MKLFPTLIAAGFSLLVASENSFAQTFAPTPAPQSTEAAQLQALAKKIDEQNAKIDTLSQQILKLEQQLSNQRPGMIIGEGAPANAGASSGATSTSTVAASDASAKAGNGNTHIVARGETLTSIARMYNVSVSDLQKLNHIDNPLKLQAGQTLIVPAPPTPAPSASSGPE